MLLIPYIDDISSKPETSVLEACQKISPVTSPIMDDISYALHPTLVTPLIQFFSQFVRFLRSQYASRPFPTYFKFPLIRKHAKDFINLTLVNFSIDDEQQRASIILQIHGNVDEIQKKKKVIRMDEIGRLANGSSARYILVQGAAGIGKTTFAWELCRQWGLKLLLQQWSALVFVQMRDKRIRQAKTLQDILYHPEPQVSQATCQLLTETDGKDILLFFDGYDEISESQQADDSVFQKLLRKELLPQAGIIVSSRPIASQSLCEQFRGQVDQHIEITGFNQENIRAYVASACSDNPQLNEDLDHYLACHPFIFSAMYVPLYCSIITELYSIHWEKGEKEFAPKTLTEVYTRLVLHLLQRHLQHQHLALKDLNTLPEDIHWRLVDIAKVASEGIRKRQYIFDSLECDHMGLMQGIQDFYVKESPSVSFAFLHQTLQEFLTAFNLTQCQSGELLQALSEPDLFPIQKYLQGEHRKCQHEVEKMFHWPVLLFIAGMTKLEHIPIDLLKSFFTSTDETGSIVQFHPAIFQLLFETQSHPLISSIFAKKTLKPHPWEMTPLDWFAAGYCIANSSPSSLWDLEYEHDHIHTVQCLELLGSGINHKLCPNKRGGTIHSIALTAGDKLQRSIDAILDLQRHIQDLSELVLGGDLNPGRKISNTLEYLISLCPSLTRIQLSTDQSLANWKALIKGLPQLKLLERVELSACFSEDDATLLNEQLQQCRSLKHLILWFEEDSDGVSALVVGVSSLVTGHLETLSVQTCVLTNKAVDVLAKSIESPQCSLSELKFHEVSASTDDFSNLAISIAKNNSIRVLQFGECGLDDTAIVCLATALIENKCLVEVEVMEFFMKEDTEQLLKQCADQNPNIKKLNLAPRNLPPAMLEYFHLNPTN